MLNKLAQIAARFDDVLHLMADPGVISDRQRYRELAFEHRKLEPVVAAYNQYKALLDQMEEGKALLSDPDPDMREMAREEVDAAAAQIPAVEQAIKVLMLPRDPNDEKNVIVEIRAGTGGDEAALFAGDIFTMYSRFADSEGWKSEILTANETDIGGFKEVIFALAGDNVYSRMKYESGVHRVQRVPQTETQGRIHTSACTVAILPEADEVELDIPTGDLRIDTYRASGAGGQHVNKTESAIRITHLPTNLVVTCQDEKSQHKNKAKALKMLRARLLQQMEADAHNERAADRKSQIGSGDRSERIRTYNYPQNRVTDHRINLTLYKLDQITNGDLAQVVEPLIEHHQAELLKSSSR
ncbi:MAG: peptide chain release factor 1 [Myxococcota bacterium]|jgi:peptide chain release factor 1